MERIEYDEFGLFHENASEYGLAWSGPPIVRRTSVEVAPGRSVSALVWGEGEPELVLVHGGAQNAHTWDTVALALGRPLVAVDLPGHGHSSWRDDGTYAPENLAADVAVVVEQLAPSAKGVVGMSLGGLTSFALAAAHGDLVRSLVIVDVTPGTTREKAKAIIDFVSGPQSFPSFDELLQRTIEHNPTRSVSSLRRGILHNAHQQDDGSWAWNYDRRNRMTQEAGASEPASDDAPLDNTRLWETVSAGRAPLLLVRGSLSPVVDDADVAELLRRQPGAEVVVVDGAGHSVQGDRPLELAALIERFVFGEGDSGARTSGRAAAAAEDPVSPVDEGPDRDALVRMYEIQTTIKQCDDRFRAMLMAGQIQLIYYSPRGQECISAGYAVHLRPDDHVVATYRGLHDHLAKGVPLRELWAEFLGKATGTCKGKGGPMHITHPASGLMVTTGIVGGGIPVANGLALAAQLDGSDRVTVVNFGDGASNIGAFHEGLNMAAVWKLPVVFVCQNNQYGEHTPLRMATAVDEISVRGKAYDMAAVTVDGNDPVAMWQAARDAVARARAGEGPTLIEAVTYRFWGHLLGDAMEYMPKEERKAAMDADPVPRFRQWLLDGGHATEEELAAIDGRAAAAIEDAVQYALDSPQPEAAELYTDVYAEVTR